MRNWGIIITAFYALVLTSLIVPGVVVVCMWESDGRHNPSWGDAFEVYDAWLTWVWVGILVGGQAVLLFVSVDSSWKRLKPRQHVLVSLVTIALVLGVLSFAAATSLLAGVFGDDAMDDALVGSQVKVLAWWTSLWLLWGIVFFLYVRQAPDRVVRVVGWLIKGSVLELLIAVPCHVIVRHRNDCSAPMATGFGIATGIAVMLLSFGPSVLFLYKKRMKQYEDSKSRSAVPKSAHPTDLRESSADESGASSEKPSS